MSSSTASHGLTNAANDVERRTYEATEGLLDELVEGRVEHHEVELGVIEAHAGVHARPCLLEVAVAVVKGAVVAGDGEGAVHGGVLDIGARLVEVVRVLHVGAAEAALGDDGRVGTDEHRDGAAAARGARVAGGIDRHIAGDDEGVAAVPGGALHPVEGVEERVGAAVAGVVGIHTFRHDVSETDREERHGANTRI